MDMLSPLPEQQSGSGGGAMSLGEESSRSKERDFDEAIAREFRPLLAEPPATTNEREILARVLLFDQVPRNAYRGDSRMFAFDALALDDARGAIRDGLDQRLHPFETLFLYLPLEHSEEITDQNESVRLFGEMRKRVAPGLESFADDVLNFAHRHREIVERFGRFPHRNAALGRASTAAEVEFLKQPGSGF